MKINKLNFLESIKKYLRNQSLEKHSIFMLFYGVLGLVWLSSLKSSYYKSLGKIYVFIACVFVLLMFFGVGLHLTQIVKHSKEKNVKRTDYSVKKPNSTVKRKNEPTSKYYKNAKCSYKKKRIKQVDNINGRRYERR